MSCVCASGMLVSGEVGLRASLQPHARDQPHVSGISVHLSTSHCITVTQGDVITAHGNMLQPSRRRASGESLRCEALHAALAARLKGFKAWCVPAFTQSV